MSKNIKYALAFDFPTPKARSLELNFTTWGYRLLCKLLRESGIDINETVTFTGKGDQLPLQKYPNLKVIVPLYQKGSNSIFKHLTGKDEILDKNAGSILDCTLNPDIKIVANYHPEWLFQGNYKYRKLSRLFFKRAKTIAEGKYKPTRRTIHISPTFDHAMQFLHFIDESNRGAFDIETIPGTKIMTCFAFSNDLEGMSIPLFYLDKNYETVSWFTPEQEFQILRQTARILTRKRIKKIMQNGVFDCQIMLDTYGIQTHNIFDTMIAQNTIMGDHLKRLSMIAAIWTDSPYHKEDKDSFIPYHSTCESLWHYNAMDTIVCDEAEPKQTRFLKKTGNWESFQDQNQLVEILYKMNSEGILRDIPKIQKEAEELKCDIRNLTKKLTTMAHAKNAAFQASLEYSQFPESIRSKWPEINEKLKGSSTSQLPYYFNRVLKAKQYKTAKKKHGFDKTVLSYLARDQHEEAKLIIDIRKKEKLLSTYYDLSKIDSDNKYRASFNPSGTRFSRLSSSGNIMGTGGNLQNQPAELKKTFLPYPDYVMYEIDYSMGEKYVTINYGNVTRALNAIRDGICLHCMTAEICRKVPWQEVLKRHQNGDSTLRSDGKTFNYAFDYGGGYQTYALKYHLTNIQGKADYTSYHNGYPQIKNNYWAEIIERIKRGYPIVNLLGRKIMFDLDPSSYDTYKKGFNAIPQSTVGELINKTMLYINDNQFTLFRDMIKGPVKRHTVFSSQVHDSIYFQVPLISSWKSHARMLLLIKKVMERELKCPNGNQFIIPIDLTISKTMSRKDGDGFELNKTEFSENINELATNLEEKWNLIQNQ